MRSTVHIQNLICDTCTKSIVKRLIELRHISDVAVDLKKETVSFDFFTKHDFEHAKHVLEMMGYTILGHDNILDA
ncbi:cation transporter [Subsaximicrobium wynnwilliamsii]|uniref:Cation transporter n=1 Tax=Subsaximicrobium wynnwilliamsii TaxID=291179 RepID=A0A5C6ZJL5_9FLAO|nr:cation transporter [Subsaximicrobium wynnwilliamsii]TXD84465.1 cation transporter [Subsaximicrobium wynnwilliamsii]TXD90146.1 cation transporter [Subsaximicrobium wynnwilliamsii]TXE04198.1 cation transporter [Subsaximicrobium wynnwilliamsii]